MTFTFQVWLVFLWVIYSDHLRRHITWPRHKGWSCHSIWPEMLQEIASSLTFFWFDIGATRELNFWSGCFIKNKYPYLSIKSSFLQLHIHTWNLQLRTLYYVFSSPLSFNIMSCMSQRSTCYKSTNMTSAQEITTRSMVISPYDVVM